MPPHDISPLTRVVTRIDRLRDGGGEVDAAIIPTGFPSLDHAIGGGFRRGALMVLGGDDGVGASAFALAMALRIRERTLMLTSEMPPERAYERALAMTARVPLDALRLGVVDEFARARLAAAAVALRDQAPIIDTLGAGGTDAVQEAAAAVPPPAVIIVDGLEALLAQDHRTAPRMGPRMGYDRDDALAAAVLAMKGVALSCNAAVLLLTHLPSLDRARADRRPRLTDFGVRGAVGTHADLVMGLYREEQYDGDLGVTGAAELLLLKSRDGALGYVDLYFSAECIRFEDVLDG